MAKHVIQATQIPQGIVITTHGLSVDVGDPETRAFIKACMHVIQLVEGTSPHSEPDVKEIHPGIKAYLNDIAKHK